MCQDVGGTKQPRGPPVDTLLLHPILSNGGGMVPNEPLEHRFCKMAATDYLKIEPSLEEEGGRPSRTNGATTGQQLTTVGTTMSAALPTHEPPSGLWRWNKDDATNNNTKIPPFSTRRRQWSVALFAVTTVLLFADQNLMAPNLTAIARTFAMTDAERDQKLAGDIALAFFVLGAPASLVVGCLGDDPRYNRAHLFGLTVGLGEGACLLTYFCQTYRQLYLCRAVTGLALGGALPLLYSVLGDLYSARDRHVVNAVVGMGTGVGISLGQGVAGLVGPTWGWRLPFVLISVPALVCAALVVGTVDDPPRGGMEEAVLHEQQHQSHVEGSDEDSDISPRVEMMPLHQDDDSLPRSQSTTHYMDSDALAQPQATHDESRKDSPTMLNAVSDRYSRRHNIWMHWKTFVSLIKTPTVILCLLQGAPGCVPWGIVNSFLNDFLSENRGMSVEVRPVAAQSHRDSLALLTFFQRIRRQPPWSFSSLVWAIFAALSWVVAWVPTCTHATSAIHRS